MKFTEHRDSNILTVKNYQPGHVTINEFNLQDSCFFNQKNLIDDWACHHITELSKALLDEVMQLNPDVIILGTGESQIFPEPKLFAHCAQKGVGLEVMDNTAACRTYNVLTTEEREVVLALIFEKADI